MKNENSVDRILRAVFAVILFFVAGQFSGAVAVILYVFAFVSAVTAMTGFCLLYKIVLRAFPRGLPR